MPLLAPSWCSSYRGHHITWHHGELVGQHSILLRAPHNGVGLFVMTNDDAFGQIIAKIITFGILGELLGLKPLPWEERLMSRELGVRPLHAAPPKDRTFKREPRGKVQQSRIQRYGIPPCGGIRPSRSSFARQPAPFRYTRSKLYFFAKVTGRVISPKYQCTPWETFRVPVPGIDPSFLKPFQAIRIDNMPWLMKAEPDTRIVKGQDVKASGLLSLKASSQES